MRFRVAGTSRSARYPHFGQSKNLAPAQVLVDRSTRTTCLECVRLVTFDDGAPSYQLRLGQGGVGVAVDASDPAPAERSSRSDNVFQHMYTVRSLPGRLDMFLCVEW